MILCCSIHFRAAMAHRKEQDYHRNDMLKLLIDLQDNATVETRQTPKTNDVPGTEEEFQFEKDARLSGVTRAAVIDEDTVTQSAVLFLFAGIDTTAHTLSMATYHLAMHPEIQDKAREEADNIAATLGNGTISYDDVKK